MTVSIDSVKAMFLTGAAGESLQIADNTGNWAGKDYWLGSAPKTSGFNVKGLSHSSRGMKTTSHASFSTGWANTVMLAFDHGCIVGSTAGIKRLGMVIDPLSALAVHTLAGALPPCLCQWTGCLTMTSPSKRLILR